MSDNNKYLLEDKMQKKVYPFELKEINGKGSFEGHAAIFGKADSLNEIIEKGAFKKTLKEKRIFPLLWYHDPTNPIGIITEIEEDDTGLRVKGELNLDVQAAREKYALMKQKAIRGLSFGFDTVKETWEGKFRRLKEIKLFEISPVTFQAHPAALISNVKQGPHPNDEDSILSPIIEPLETKDKPHLHLFDSIIKTLEG